MAFTILPRGQYHLVRLESEDIGMAAVRHLEETLNRLFLMGARHVVLDCTGIDRMASQLLGMIGCLYRKTKEKELSLGVILKNPEMVEAFNLSGFQERVKIFSEAEELGMPESTEALLCRQGCFELLVQMPFHVIRLWREPTNWEENLDLNQIVDSLLEKGIRRFLFDFGDFSLYSSNVLSSLASCYSAIQNGDGDIRIIARNRQTRDFLSIGGLNAKIPFYAGPEEFLDSLSDSDKQSQAKTILIVEDDTAIGKWLVASVQQLGYRPLLAKDGKEGIELASRERPDAVLMDIQLPFIDGYQACRVIKKMAGEAHLPVIFMTAGSNPHLLLDALEVGGDDYIHKPFPIEELIFRLRTHLKMRELYQSLQLMNDNLEKLVDKKSSSLKEVERQLFQAEKISVISTLLSGIAHELRNPLCAINGYAQMLRLRTPMTERQGEMMRQIEDQAVRANSILEAFFNLTRKKYAQPTFFSVDELVGKLKTGLDCMISGKHIEVTTDLKVWRTLKANAAEIEQVIVDLFSNAVDAIDKDGRIVIRTREEGNFCVIEIEDNGSGIPPEMQKKIFDPFFTTKEPGKGTGLGLSVALKIAEDHRGRIQLKSEMGKGSCFSVHLPFIE